MQTVGETNGNEKMQRKSEPRFPFGNLQPGPGVLLPGRAVKGII